MEEVKEEEEEEEEVEMKSKGDEKVRVLVVDDSPVDRRIVELLFKRCGGVFEVVAVDSGVRAMEVLGLNEGKGGSSTINGQKIDVILTDYCMPEVTGYDLLKAVKEHSNRRLIPVAIMSSENDPQRINRCQAIGAEDFFIKPLKVQDAQRMRNYARPIRVSPSAGKKRKISLDLLAESNGSERRSPLAGVAVA